MLFIALLLACGTTDPPADKPISDTDTTVPTDPYGTTDDTDEPVGPGNGVLLINEVVTDNESTWQFDGDALPDWIELYNPGTAAIVLSTVTIADDSDTVWQGTEGTIEPGERLVLAADEYGTVGYLPFSLAADGDELVVTVDGEVADRVIIPELPSDVAWARIPDGSPTWGATTETTPDDTNPEVASTDLDPKTAALSDAMFHQLEFEITPEQYAILNTNNEEWAFSELTLDGIHFDKIDMRLKGSASFDLMDGKPAFKIDLNQYEPERRFREMKGFKLHNGNILDPTRTRDSISYQLARESGIMAPRVGWAEVYVNDSYFGIYMMIEDYDTDMIEEWFPGEKDLGAIFEPNEQQQGGGWGGDFCSGDVEFQYEVGPIPPDPLALEALNQASSICGKSSTDENVLALWDHVDQEDLYNYMAWEAMVGHTDGYKAPNNWRVYVDASYKVHLVPSGAEWTWDSTVQPWTSNGQLVDFCLDNVGCKRDYAEHLLTMADKVEELDLLTRFEDLSIWLDPLLQSDPRSPHNSNDITNARGSTRQHIEDNPGDIRDDVDQEFPGL